MSVPTRFEERLLQELRQVVAERSGPAVGTTATFAPRVSRRRTRLALSGAGVAAVTAAVALVATSGNVTASAYAVEPRADGSVTVHIRSLRDAAGLERKLRAAGLPAVVRYVPEGSAEPCPMPSAGPGQPAPSTEIGKESAGAEDGPSFHTNGNGNEATPPPNPPDGATSSQVQVTDDGVTFTLDPGEIKPGEHVAITTSDGRMSSMSIAVTRDNGTPCAPPAPPGSPRTQGR